MTNKEINELIPAEKYRLIDLVELAGIDTSDWSNFKGGPRKASANPKYCYEWCFTQGDLTILNLWYDQIEIIDNQIIQKHNFRLYSERENGSRRARAKRADDAIRNSYINKLPVRVIILTRGKSDRVKLRNLDSAHWVISKYDESSGDCTICRKGIYNYNDKNLDYEFESFSEGEQQSRFAMHRKRENKLRNSKIASYLKENGNLRCEVPRCGFDFFELYGELGREYAHVHHKIPLSTAPPDGFTVRLEDLAVVCANCHSMIHRGGECRPIDSLIPEANEGLEIGCSTRS